MLREASIPLPDNARIEVVPGSRDEQSLQALAELAAPRENFGGVLDLVILSGSCASAFSGVMALLRQGHFTTVDDPQASNPSWAVHLARFGMEAEDLPEAITLCNRMEKLRELAPAHDSELVQGAAETGNIAALRALQAQGVNLQAPDAHGNSGLHHASGAGQVEAVRWLLKAGVPADLPGQDGLGALSFAAHPHIVRELAAAGADVNKGFI